MHDIDDVLKEWDDFLDVSFDLVNKWKPGREMPILSLCLIAISPWL